MPLHWKPGLARLGSVLVASLLAAVLCHGMLRSQRQAEANKRRDAAQSLCRVHAALFEALITRQAALTRAVARAVQPSQTDDSTLWTRVQYLLDTESEHQVAYLRRGELAQACVASSAASDEAGAEPTHHDVRSQMYISAESLANLNWDGSKAGATSQVQQLGPVQVDESGVVLLASSVVIPVDTAGVNCTANETPAIGEQGRVTLAIPWSRLVQQAALPGIEFWVQAGGQAQRELQKATPAATSNLLADSHLPSVSVPLEISGLDIRLHHPLTQPTRAAWPWPLLAAAITGGVACLCRNPFSLARLAPVNGDGTHRDTTELQPAIDQRSSEQCAAEQRLSASFRAAEKTLSGLLPICADCKSIRDEHGRWHRLEAYIIAHSEADFTHGMCPECVPRHYSLAKLKAASQEMAAVQVD